ncbi:MULTISPECIES: transporter substrate-binding domain-containing protein [unclassified Pseudomonas]|uniref:transporter substrate-binding domain-containing protein n=1 Tax=unclassified Pseudomonas TaxID=196821 RepID=UPI001911B031|nr:MULTISPECIES: transporter substrate-binding domain-containing protein [unclassified Pseudomonas]MBK5553480.1 transporter substrate-binding domain-containing protein [Pseudomonas sp. TH03]MEB0225179.1 transporter substrate-binding domain-containing protein [Pseudomonas sp. 5S1]MEB0293975.1 transporter substrate-binding domain-containing protein [Pseudomonas sp. 10S4]WPX17026.1 transporter substrate-binding domain-containing protein [Pseudomonas sp. 10S4]
MNNKPHALLLCGLLALPWGVQAQETPSHLDSVMQQGLLTVCTTGDYKPYTYKNENGEYEGIDIAMARSLADSLGAKVNWVQTTWKTLMPDLLAGKCDIAMGGISVTLERQKKAYFSSTLDVDGKVPLVRCEDQARYQTIEQINQPSVRLIEPAGGTNEAFVHAFLPKAQLMLHDNVTLFQALLDKKADVMITDASEALYQQKLKPGLCAVNPGHYFQYGEKAYLLPRDDITWKQYVDQWLHLTKVTGNYQKVVGEWLASPEQ